MKISSLLISCHVTYSRYFRWVTKFAVGNWNVNSVPSPRDSWICSWNFWICRGCCLDLPILEPSRKKKGRRIIYFELIRFCIFLFIFFNSLSGSMPCWSFVVLWKNFLKQIFFQNFCFSLFNYSIVAEVIINTFWFPSYSNKWCNFLKILGNRILMFQSFSRLSCAVFSFDK